MYIHGTIPSAWKYCANFVRSIYYHVLQLAMPLRKIVNLCANLLLLTAEEGAFTKSWFTNRDFSNNAKPAVISPQCIYGAEICIKPRYYGVIIVQCINSGLELGKIEEDPDKNCSSCDVATIFKWGRNYCDFLVNHNLTNLCFTPSLC